MERDNITKTVIELYKEKNWSEILKISEVNKNENIRHLIWVWPSMKNLDFIKRNLFERNLKKIISIGCGCGLFEWIFMEYSGLEVIGYEINQEWWESKYSGPKFLKLNFPIQPFCNETLSSTAALLFCYFNDASAFKDYVNCYEGNLIFIVGPGEGRGTHTDPQPFKSNLDVLKWRLYDFQEVRCSKDFIAVYLRVP